MPKISELPIGTTPSGAEYGPFVQSGTTVRLTVAQISGVSSGSATVRETFTSSSGTISSTTTDAIVNRAAPSTTALVMPDASVRVPAGQTRGAPLMIIDYSTSVTAHLITLTPAFVAQKIMRQSTWGLYSNTDSLAFATFVPIVDPDNAANYVWVLE